MTNDMPRIRLDKRSIVDRLVNACLTLLVAAIALVLAVHLIEAVWVPLVIGLGSLSAAGAVVTWWRRRSRGW